MKVTRLSSVGVIAMLLTGCYETTVISTLELGPPEQKARDVHVVYMKTNTITGSVERCFINTRERVKDCYDDLKENDR